MFTCGVCSQRFGHLKSFNNHKKIHKNNYHLECETGTSTDTYSFDNNDLISDNQEIDNESSIVFDIQSTSGESNLILDNQKIDNDESSSMLNTQSTSKDRKNMFVDEINESQNDDSKYSDICEVNNEDFPSNVYRDFINIVIIMPILSAVKEILQHGEIAANSNFQYNSKLNISLEMPEKSILRILQLQMVDLGNIPTTLRNRAKTKTLVSIILILKETKEEQQTPQFRQLI
ncbi:12937_t:CDS:2 [Dentiscutata heterogama]|uniref:12937_t:CDS:1 n=1 Tax=Dentiscutata heterogama TaxID=1316150 RepID=A0ACA9L6M4_9GLOM|nr:12937_t:CDS:2 [Dentiscutata heterogama]